MEKGNDFLEKLPYFKNLIKNKIESFVCSMCNPEKT